MATALHGRRSAAVECLPATALALAVLLTAVQPAHLLGAWSPPSPAAGALRQQDAPASAEVLAALDRHGKALTGAGAPPAPC